MQCTEQDSGRDKDPEVGSSLLDELCDGCHELAVLIWDMRDASDRHILYPSMLLNRFSKKHELWPTPLTTRQSYLPVYGESEVRLKDWRRQ